MYNKLTVVDELTRPDHYYLETTDWCAYFGEYTARKGATFSTTNQLITNIKKPVTRKHLPDYAYKIKAIQTIALDFIRIIGAPHNVTFVPVPPSKSRSHPEYDDRMLQILTIVRAYLPLFDFRELVIQNTSTVAAHHTAEGESRPKPCDLSSIYSIDSQLAHGVRENIVIFDDVLTTGAHFKAMQHVLSNVFPSANIHGIFIARRAPHTDDIDDFFND